jgi:hypothetical protein
MEQSMMRRFLLAAVVATIPITLHAKSPHAQSLGGPMKDPRTGFDSNTWAEMARGVIDATAILGKPMVYMVNATPYEMTVNCDKWSLVGPKPYLSDNPHTLHPWKATLVKTNGFDGYCKSGVAGLDSNGDLYRGRFNAPNGSFTDSTFITFDQANKQH